MNTLFSRNQRWIRLMAGLGWASVAGAQPAVAPDVVRDIEYARAGQKSLRLDLYRPRHARPRLPVIVSIHGGGWHSGSKEASPGTGFTEYGYAVAAIDYRLTGEATFPAQIEDSKAAVRWVRFYAADYGLNPDRIGVWGASAGGHLAALLGTSGGVAALEGDAGPTGVSSRVQAVVDFFGPIDVAAWYRFKRQPIANLIGAPVEGNEDRLRAANPITFVTPDDPPFFIAHGAQDTLVPTSQSVLLHEALRQAGVEASLTLVPGAGHSVKQLRLDEQVRRFFDRHLR